MKSESRHRLGAHHANFGGPQCVKWEIIFYLIKKFQVLSLPKKGKLFQNFIIIMIMIIINNEKKIVTPIKNSNNNNKQQTIDRQTNNFVT